VERKFTCIRVNIGKPDQELNTSVSIGAAKLPALTTIRISDVAACYLREVNTRPLVDVGAVRFDNCLQMVERKTISGTPSLVKSMNSGSLRST
jgi:hypothetical protein